LQALIQGNRYGLLATLIKVNISILNHRMTIFKLGKVTEEE
jgi:hypothetical protein